MGIFNPLFRSARRNTGELHGWTQAGPQDLPGIEEALQSREALSVNLMDAFFRLQTRVDPGNRLGEPSRTRRYLQAWKNDWWVHFVLRRDASARIVALLAFASNGYLYSLDTGDGESGPEAWKAGLQLLLSLTPRFDSRLFGSILHQPSTAGLLPSLESRIRTRIAYQVLALPCPDGGRSDWMPPPLPEYRDDSLFPGLYIRSGRTQDSGWLLDIQCAYEVEEVLCPGQAVDPDNSLARLEHLLKKHRVYLAHLEGEAVAKAGTNALSWHYVQIGGVYTKPRYRNHGIASELVSLLVEDARSCGLGSCLFVKADNAPALKVYAHLGFEACGRIDIMYYR